MNALSLFRSGHTTIAISNLMGISEAEAYNEIHRLREMKEVAGSVYRALLHAKQAYDRACEANEAAADRYKAERLHLRGNNETTSEKSAAAGLGKIAVKFRKKGSA